jgi:hypothetical protein
MVQELPDPQGFIKKIRDSLKPECAVARSPFCDHIISQRMQKVPFKRIEEWLSNQGNGDENFRITASSLCKNFKDTRLSVSLSYAEDLIDRSGGSVHLDCVYELAMSVITQKRRVDSLTRSEKSVQESQDLKDHQNRIYLDERIKSEYELLLKMMSQFGKLTEKLPEEVLKERHSKLEELERGSLAMSPSVVKSLSDMIVSGDISLNRGVPSNRNKDESAKKRNTNR